PDMKCRDAVFKMGRVVLIAVASGLAAATAQASGGDVSLVTDDTFDGTTYCLATPGGDRFVTDYTDPFEPGAILCGARVGELNTGAPEYSGTLQGELRAEDPGNPGYPDLSGAGLIASADPSSEGPCGRSTTVFRFWTFGGGAGIGDVPVRKFLCAVDPP